MVIYICGNCGSDVGEDDLCPCYIGSILPATNEDLGFGPGSDDEQDELQWFLASGRIIA